MPLKRCTINGKRGWKWGDAGKCYTGPKGKAKAIKQAQAIRASGYEENSNGEEESDVIEVMLRNAKRRKAKPTPNPLKRDPTRTKTLRDRFQRELRKRFRILKRRIRELLVEEDALGLKSKRKPQRVDRALDTSRWVEHSYFSECERHDKGRCLPSGDGEEEAGVGTSKRMEEPSPWPSPEKITEVVGRAVKASLEEVKEGKVPFVKYGSKPYSATVAEYNGDGTVTVTDRFFEQDTFGRNLTMLHEFGHEVAMRSLSGGTASKRTMEVLEPLKTGGSGAYATYDNFAGFSSRPDEMLADVYAELASAKSNPWESEKRQSVQKHVAAVADKAGLPIQPWARELIGSSQTRNVENAYQGGRWRFMTSKGVLDMFLKWLQGQFKELIAPEGEEGSFLDGYIEEGFRRGMERAFDDTRRSQRVLEEIKKSAEEFDKKDFYEGSKREFLRSSFGRRIAKSKVELLAERTLTDLKGVAESSARKMQHILLDGLVEGQHPRKMARDMSKALDIDRKRAERIARTEIIRTHAEGQLQALEDIGVDEIGVMVEWATAGDGRVCPLCEELEGVVLKVKEAHNLLPRHPNCRCAYIPANVSEEDTKQQVVEKPKIESAIESSIKKEGKEPSETSWAGADVRIEKTGRKPSK